MNKTIKLKFVDFWKNFNPLDNYFYKFLTEHYDVQLSEEPDYLFFSVYGFEHLKYDSCIKIHYTGENMVPDFNLCDYALGFQPMAIGDRYMRFPLYLIYEGFDALKAIKKIDKNLNNRKFCNFVYSNNVNADPVRTIFFHQLSKYKKIDSGGRYLNNIGGPVQDKIEFIKNYKFTIAFENSSSFGYTTEKIMEPMRVLSMPIYFGNPMVDQDFNPDSFVWMQDQHGVEETVERIIELDKDGDKYLDRISEPWLNEIQKGRKWDEELFHFFENIFIQSFDSAKRIPKYGYTDFNLKVLSAMNQSHQRTLKINRTKSKIKKIIQFKL